MCGQLYIRDDATNRPPIYYGYCGIVIHNPQINISKIVVGGGIAGLFFAAVSTLIFLMGIPLTRIMLPAALILGGGIALILHFARHRTLGTPWILPGTKK